MASKNLIYYRLDFTALTGTPVLPSLNAQNSYVLPLYGEITAHLTDKNVTCKSRSEKGKVISISVGGFRVEYRVFKAVCHL